MVARGEPFQDLSEACSGAIRSSSARESNSHTEAHALGLSVFTLLRMVEHTFASPALFSVEVPISVFDFHWARGPSMRFFAEAYHHL